MSNVINRETLQYIKSVNTPDYPTENWIINPDLSAVQNYPIKYWKISGDSILLQNSSEMDTTDSLYLTQSGVYFQDSILSVTNPDPFLGVSGTVVVSGGLNLVTNVPNLIVNDVTTVSADPDFTKNVLISVIYNTTSGTFGVVAREKTTDEFADLLSEEIIIKDLAEFLVVAGGSTLQSV